MKRFKRRLKAEKELQKGAGALSSQQTVKKGMR